MSERIKGGNEKELSEEEKKNRKKALILKIVPVAVLAFILIAVSLAWFTLDKALDLDSFGMTSVDSPFELMTEGSQDGLQDKILDSKEYSNSTVNEDSNVTSEKYSKIYWLMNDESNMKNQSADSAGINPGTSGKLTFYVVPKQSGRLDIKFKLNITGYTESGTGDNTTYAPVKDEDINNYVNGHIMFFENYDGTKKTYSKFLHNETFERTFDDCKVDEPIAVDIYWVWPNTLGQILLKSSDSNLSENNVLFGDNSDERTDFAKYIIDNASKFFKSDDHISEDNKNAIINMLTGKSYNASQLAALSSLYNNADEAIGTSVNDLLVELTAQSE